jgi:TonB family protein
VPTTHNITPLSGYRRLWILVGGLALLFALAAPSTYAEDKKQEASDSEEAQATRIPRRLVHKVDPVYPQDLKRRSIGGVVKLDLKITANGKVDKVSIVGGNPILADSAAQAVKQWQYAPAPAASSLLLNVEFNPNR